MTEDVAGEPPSEVPPSGFRSTVLRTVLLVFVVIAAIAVRTALKGGDRLSAKVNIVCLFAPIAGILTWSVQRLSRRRWPWYAEGVAILFLTPAIILLVLQIRIVLRI